MTYDEFLDDYFSKNPNARKEAYGNPNKADELYETWKNNEKRRNEEAANIAEVKRGMEKRQRKDAGAEILGDIGGKAQSYVTGFSKGFPLANPALRAATGENYKDWEEAAENYPTQSGGGELAGNLAGALPVGAAFGIGKTALGTAGKAALAGGAQSLSTRGVQEAYAAKDGKQSAAEAAAKSAIHAGTNALGNVPGAYLGAKVFDKVKQPIIKVLGKAASEGAGNVLAGELERRAFDEPFAPKRTASDFLIGAGLSAGMDLATGNVKPQTQSKIETQSKAQSKSEIKPQTQTPKLSEIEILGIKNKNYVVRIIPSTDTSTFAEAMYEIHNREYEKNEILQRDLDLANARQQRRDKVYKEIMVITTDAQKDIKDWQENSTLIELMR